VRGRPVRQIVTRFAGASLRRTVAWRLLSWVWTQLQMTQLPMIPMLATDPAVLIAGRYGLVRQLAVGGMAEVWLARQRGLEGFEKLVVVKRILPHLANDPEFVQMFLDEARTAADLRHSNVASVTDVGTEAGAYFIAMEYLHGQDLTHIVQRCKVRGEKIPLQHILQMISDAAQGLDYAHRKVDRHGEAQQIVHRDVSPQNVLVTYEGATKVLDFGIASASHRTTHTDAGVVKGKYAYMSPEQFDGGALDARSDLFSLGVVLWELVTLQRLFWKPSDAETLRAVMECKVPRPSKVAECPPELEELILHALQRNPSKRFGSCGDFADALDLMLENMRLPHTPSRVGAWLRGIFPEHTLDPTEIPIVPPAMPDAPTRNEKIRPEQYPGSKTHQTPSKEEAPPKIAVVHAFSTGDSLRARLNLVPPISAFFGRPLELEQLATHFDQRARLVTVTGVPGQGKSRLAARFVELQRGRWLNKVSTVELADARTPEAVIQAITIACGLDPQGVPETPQQLLAETAELMTGLGPALVILNNLELTASEAAPLIEQLLSAAPQLALLVTRREPLKSPDERVLELSGLDASGPDSEAVRMFLAHLERAGVAAPSTPAELQCVSEICKRVQGLPLAIELVAARAEAQKLEVLLQRLNARFSLRGLEAPTDHSTLASAVDWAFHLLTEVETQALTQLSVFRGSFTLEAAERILRLDGGEDVAALFESLLRKSLLRTYVARETPGRMRFRLPEGVVAHAAAELERLGRGPALRASHAQWFLQQGEEWAEEVYGAVAAERMALLSVERDNLLEVLDRAQATQPPTATSSSIALRALHGLDPLLSRTGPYATYLTTLERAITVATELGAEKAYVARAMHERANVQRNRGQPGQAMLGMTYALKLVRQADDRALEGRILCDWALTCFANADVDGAITGLEKSLEIARAVGDTAFEVKALSLQAMVYVARRELTKALACCDEALPLARSRGDAVSEARVLGTVGSLFLEERRTELARAFFSDAVARCEQVDEQALKGYFLGKLAQVLAECDEIEEARAKVEEALKVLHHVGDLRNEGLFLSLSAWLEALAGRSDSSKVALKAAEVKLEAAKDPLLLTALTLRKMQLRLMDRDVAPQDVRTLLREVRTAVGTTRARVAMSDEVRLVALQLERTLRSS
jgi:serine/threonine protein kinase/predicted ATPase